ncbi:hypothetical protein TK49_07500 [Ralstonia mannitolilytica]|nr:hypothetical protein TK49_07500 [Ralstonia mannitolilytica]
MIGIYLMICWPDFRVSDLIGALFLLQDIEERILVEDLNKFAWQSLSSLSAMRRWTLCIQCTLIRMCESP